MGWFAGEKRAQNKMAVGYEIICYFILLGSSILPQGLGILLFLILIFFNPH